MKPLSPSLKSLVAAIIILALSLAAQAASLFTTGKLFDAQALMPTPREVVVKARDGKPEWTCAGKDLGNVTFFSGGLEKVETTAEGTLKFALGKEGAQLGWGNYEGKQPHAERVHLPVGPMTVSVMLRASATGRVTFLPWCDGAAGGKVAESKDTRAANRKRAKPAEDAALQPGDGGKRGVIFSSRNGLLRKSRNCAGW